MMTRSTDPVDFDALRPELMALLELHRAAQTDEARRALVGLFENLFLATAWNVAQDLLENGWAPGFSGQAPRSKRSDLRVIGGVDAA
jgi:hypothetical protein